jgi:hypothetical protein
MSDDVSKNIHSRDQVWSAISNVAQAQSATEARISALETTVDAGFSNLQQSIQQLAVQTRPQPANIPAFVGIALAVLTLFGGYTALISFPLQKQIDRNESHLEELHETQGELAAVKAELKYMNEKINDVDAFGSRRWLYAPKEPSAN